MGLFTDAIRLPSAKFPVIGDTASGVVADLGMSAVPEFDDRGRVSGVKLGDDGEEVMQVDVTLTTDSGLVVLHTSGAIFYAIGRALAEIGEDDLEVGDVLIVTYTGDGEPTAKGRNAPKQYTAAISKRGADKAATITAPDTK